MKEVKTTEAVGHVLCHDMTQIIPGVTKDARFRKGHVVAEEDIPVLLSMGKERLFVWEKTEGMLHEDEAADTGLVDYFVNTRELYRIIERTGGAPYRRNPAEVENIDDYEKEARYPDLLNCEGWQLSGDAEEISFKKKGGRKVYKAAVCHNLAQAAKVLEAPEKYDVIRIMG